MSILATLAHAVISFTLCQMWEQLLLCYARHFALLYSKQFVLSCKKSCILLIVQVMILYHFWLMVKIIIVHQIQFFRCSLLVSSWTLQQTGHFVSCNCCHNVLGSWWTSTAIASNPSWLFFHLLIVSTKLCDQEAFIQLTTYQYKVMAPRLRI